MTSPEEAQFFLANCPGVKMDGGDDGVPCERQWCGDR
jgi:Excalibur calcium-binding domain